MLDMQHGNITISGVYIYSISAGHTTHCWTHGCWCCSCGLYSIQAWQAYKLQGKAYSPKDAEILRRWISSYNDPMGSWSLILGIRCMLYKRIIFIPQSSILYVSLSIHIFTSRTLAPSHAPETVLSRIQHQHST